MAYDPRGMSFERWSALTAQSLLPYGSVASSAQEETWKQWGESVKNVPALQARSVPSTRGFSDWQSWAFRLNEGLRSLGL